MKFQLFTLCLMTCVLAESSEQIVGIAYSEHTKKVSTNAVTQGQASNDGHCLEKNAKGWISPQIVEKIAETIAPTDSGPLEHAEEIPSETQYYDGSHKLNVKATGCTMFKISTPCMKAPTCGWC